MDRWSGQFWGRECDDAASDGHSAARGLCRESDQYFDRTGRIALFGRRSHPDCGYWAFDRLPVAANEIERPGNSRLDVIVRIHSSSAFSPS